MDYAPLSLRFRLQTIHYQVTSLRGALLCDDQGAHSAMIRELPVCPAFMVL